MQLDDEYITDFADNTDELTQRRDTVKKELVKLWVYDETGNPNDLFISLDFEQDVRDDVASMMSYVIQLKFDISIEPKVLSSITIQQLISKIVEEGSFKGNFFSDKYELSFDWNLLYGIIDFYILNGFPNTYVWSGNEGEILSNRKFLNIDINELLYYIYNEKSDILGGIKNFVGGVSSFQDLKRSFVITNKGIYFKQLSLSGVLWDEIEVQAVSWSNITSIEYKDGLFCVFTQDDKSNYWALPIDSVINPYVPWNTKIAFINMCNEMVAFVDSNKDFTRLNKVINQVAKAIDDNNYKTAIEIANNYIDKYELEQLGIAYAYELYYFLAWAYELNGELDEAIRTINKLFAGENVIELYDDLEKRSHALRGRVLLNSGQIDSARTDLLEALDTSNQERKSHVLLNFNECDEKYVHAFTRKPYPNRKFIMPVRQLDGYMSKIEEIKVFSIDNLPEVNFPVGHPIPNEVYIGHPLSSDIYIPLEGYEHQFFLDKVDELTYLLQCLGAEEITIRSLKGKKVGEIASEVKAIGTSFGNKIGSIGWDVNTAVNTEGETQNTNKIELAHHFTPKVQPYVPDGLVWYPNEARWHRIVEKRLHGTQIFFQEKISTSDVRFVSRNEVKGLEGEINYFNSHLKGSKKTESEIKLKSFEETEWEISVRFAPVESLRQVGENNVESEPNLIIGELEKKSETELIESMDFTDAEKIYMAECKELYVDGNEITISEKRLLNRLSESLAIS
ncbi:MAG: hypothetical protein QM305_02405 [Bacteroidota bacterium]|nr:hypothetical protein [Bacteroidota bacterium]